MIARTHLSSDGLGRICPLTQGEVLININDSVPLLNQRRSLRLIFRILSRKPLEYPGHVHEQDLQSKLDHLSSAMSKSR